MNHTCERCMRSMNSWQPCWINNGSDVSRHHLCVACRRQHNAVVDKRLTGEEVQIINRIKEGRDERRERKAAGRERRRIEIMEQNRQM
jgi:hypothetical protein